MNISEFRNKVENSTNVLLVLPYLVDPDSIATASLLYRFLVSKGKKVDIAAEKVPVTIFNNIFSLAGIEATKILNKISPIRYVISVSNVSDKTSIDWERRADQLDIKLTPDAGIVDFESITYSREGGIYDLVITINVGRLSDLGEIYTSIPKKFEEYEIVSIGGNLNLEGRAIVSLSQDQWMSTELLYSYADDLNFEIDQTNATVMLHGIVGQTHGLQKVYSNNTFAIVTDIANRYQIDLPAIIKQYFASINVDSVRVEEKILNNMKFDESRKTVYSYLTNRDLAQLGISYNNFDYNYYLPFGVDGRYYYSFIVLESGLSSFVYLVSPLESEEYMGIVNRSNAIRNKTLAHISIDADAINAANQVLRVISGGTLLQRQQEETKVGIDSSPVAHNIDTISQSWGHNDNTNQQTISAPAIPLNSPNSVGSSVGAYIMTGTNTVSDQGMAHSTEPSFNPGSVYPTEPSPFQKAGDAQINAVVSHPVNLLYQNTSPAVPPVSPVTPINN